MKILRIGERVKLKEPAMLILEDGTQLKATASLPKDLPVGYHEMISLKDGRKTHLMVSPGSCHLPKSLKRWGWAVQLYALRSARSWGMGDLHDLRQFGQWVSQNQKCDFILANPLGAALSFVPQQASPYFPSSRRFLNPLYLRVEDVPGASAASVSLDSIASAGRALNQERLIDRDAIFKLKMEALEKIWRHFHSRPAFDTFCRVQGPALSEFAAFSVLAQYFKSGWTRWPRAFQRVDSPAVRRFVQEHDDQIRFHKWLQWLLDQQFRKAAGVLPVMQDLPIGVDPGGADAWSWQDMLAREMAIGAPPDAFNGEGQNWGMQPFIPHRLRAAGYEPFRQTLQAMLRFGGGLRIDHVMGLFRLFWIPQGRPARDGAYVYYPVDELLAVLAIESHRTKAVIVGEDLGTVEQGVRRKLHRHKVLSYRLLWFEKGMPRNYPKQSLAAVTTHDLFTVAGLWNGSDVANQKKAGLHPNEKGTQQLQARLRRQLRLTSKATAAEAITSTYQLLSKSPSMLVTAALVDALAVEERPNMPGTTTEWPNWRLALPLPLEAIVHSGLMKKISLACRRKKTG